MSTIICRTDPSCKYAIGLTDDKCLNVYSITKNDLNLLKSFIIDAEDVQFLPPSLGLAFIVAEKNGQLSIYRLRNMEWKIYKLEDINPFTKCLRVSPYPPQLRVGWISNDEIMIFDIFLEDTPKLLPIKKFTHPNKFTYFNFGLTSSIYAVCGGMIWKFDMDKSISSEPYELKEKVSIIEPSPINTEVSVIAFESGKVFIITMVEGVFSERLMIPIQHNVKSVNALQWSPLGTSLLIGGDHVEEWKEVSPGNWCLSK